MKTATFARNTKRALRTVIFLLMLLSMVALSMFINPRSAKAYSDTYPTSIAGCRAVSGNPSGYFTCDLKDSTQDIYYDPWGEENRECTSYVAWMLHSVNGFEMPFFANAVDWKTKAQNLHYTVDMKPMPGSVYWQAGTVTNPAGHVAYVQAVSSDGTHVDTTDYNLDFTGHWAQETNVATSSAGGYIHFKDINTSSLPLRIGALYSTGGYIAKENSLSSGWVTMSNDSTTQIMQNGSLSGMIWNGQFLVKQGALTNNWVTEATNGAIAGSLSDTDGTNPIRIGMLTDAGAFLVKEGLTGTWVTEYSANVTAGYVSGNRIAVLLSSGAFLVKEGSLSSGWDYEYTANVSQGIISGKLIGVVTGGVLLVKQGALDSGWVTENGNVANAQLSDATSSTPVRIGVIYTDGTYQVKEGISGGWVTENGNVSKAALSGNLIGIVFTDGTFQVKQGGLGAGWVTENGNITQIALWSPN